MHSSFSDGEFSPEQLVDIAQKNNVTLLSLTDHDTFEGIHTFLNSAKEAHIEAFPGIEITVKHSQDFAFRAKAHFCILLSRKFSRSGFIFPMKVLTMFGR